MKRKIILTLVVMLTLCGCGKTIPVLDNGEETVVSFEKDEKISVDDLYEEMKNSYALQTLINMIDKKILEEKYKDKLEEAEKSANSTLETIKTNFVDENGKYDENSLVSALNQYYGYTSVKEYTDSLKLNYLRNLAVEDYAKGQVTEGDIKKYYKSDIVGDREVSHIQIIPKVKDNMTDDEKEEKEKEALNTAKEVIAKLKKGESFSDLAEEYSDDESTKDSGGSLGYINKGTYGSDKFDEEVYSLKIGSFSNTPVKTTNGYEIVYVTNEKEKEALDKVKDKIIETLAEQNLSKNATLQVEGLKALRKDAGMEIVDSELKRQYEKYMNNAYNSALEQNN